MEITVPTIMETQLTGFIGGVRIARGRVQYQVNLIGGKMPVCMIDGRDVPADHNATMARLVKNARKFFNV